jgi:hypothetical protein
MVSMDRAAAIVRLVIKRLMNSGHTAMRILPADPEKLFSG